MICSTITGQPDGKLSEAEEKGTRIGKDEKHFSSTVKLLAPCSSEYSKSVFATVDGQERSNMSLVWGVSISAGPDTHQKHY